MKIYTIYLSIFISLILAITGCTLYDTKNPMHSPESIATHNETRPVTNEAYAIIADLLGALPKTDELYKFSQAMSEAYTISESTTEEYTKMNPSGSDAIQFTYKFERTADEARKLILPFLISSDPMIKSCAQEIDRCYQYRKDLFTEVRECEATGKRTPHLNKLIGRYKEQREHVNDQLHKLYANKHNLYKL